MIFVRRKRDLLTKLLKVGTYRGQGRKEQMLLAVTWMLPFLELYSQVWVC